MVEKKFNRSGWIFLITVFGVCIAVSLGFWQLRRAEAKQNVYDMRMARKLLPALQNKDLPCSTDQWLTNEQRHATLKGHWLHERTVVLDNRTMSGRAGFVVLTPLLLEPAPKTAGCAKSNLAVLVQRGWLPRDTRDRSLIPVFSQPTGLQTVSARLSPPPSQRIVLQTQTSAEQGVLRQNVDMAALSHEWRLSLLPGSAQQLANEKDTNSVDQRDRQMLRQWWQPDADISKHHGYAAQWFLISLTLLSLYVWFQWWQPWRSTIKN